MRASGILMPVFSLPGPFGIGTLGKEAFAFVDFLADAKQTYWQILPIGPTGYGDSPYQSFSAFAGNPYFIDYRLLADVGLLTADEVPAARPVGPIDYGALYNERPVILKKAAYKSAKSTVLSCGVFSIWVFGNFAPIFLNRESYMVMLTEGYGAEYAATLNTYMPMWIAPILLVACFVFGLVGGMIGKAICKKHFQRAGIA